MANVSSSNKEIAKYVAPIIGINPTAKRYWDEDNKNFIDVFSVTDPLHTEIQFHGTIGVSEVPLKMQNKEQDFRIELLIGADKKFTDTPNILSTCGFYITKDYWECKPGTVFMRIVDMYYKDLEMKHIYFNTPFVWEDKLQPLQLPDKKIVWLLAIPISENELQYKIKKGHEALEDLFAENRVDVFDLQRKSVV